MIVIAQRIMIVPQLFVEFESSKVGAKRLFLLVHMLALMLMVINESLAISQPKSESRWCAKTISVECVLSLVF